MLKILEVGKTYKIDFGDHEDDIREMTVMNIHDTISTGTFADMENSNDDYALIFAIVTISQVEKPELIVRTEHETQGSSDWMYAAFPSPVLFVEEERDGTVICLD